MDQEVYKSVWWVLALPVFGFLIQAFTGKIIIDNLGPKIGRKVMGAIAVMPIAAAFALGAQITAALVKSPEESRVHILTLFQWITVGNLSIPFEVRVDPLSMTMVLIITGIGSLIHLYATGYMAEEPDFPRFFTYLNLFVAAMLILVLGNNLALLFVGWEGVGVCSYLLIGFWYKDKANSFASNKAFIVNRVGDWGLTLGMFTLAFMASQTLGPLGGDPRWLSYDVLLPNAQALASGFDPAFLTAACILLFIGAMGKSAQFPLYIWLPDAMAGPTPVSALIHAATMVTSGVFLLNRMSPFFALSPTAGAVVAITGAITALLGAVIAFGQTDIKKVLAYSTVSQLGYMFIACGVGAYWVGLFHVATHAFFKALLFLGSGAVIHAMAHNQDMRNYGKLLKYLPITGATMLVGWLAIAGLPFMSGAFSKEEILLSSFNSHLNMGGVPVGTVVFGVALFVAILTALYMSRMTYMTFFSGSERWRLIPAHGGHGHDSHHGHDGHHQDHHQDHHHGPDVHDFYYDDVELAAIEAATPHDHHHELDENHEPHEVPPSMWIPLAVLAVLSIVGGGWLFFGVNLAEWLHSGGVVVDHHEHIESIGAFVTETLQRPIFWMATAAFAVGVAGGWLIYGKKLPEDDGMDTAKWKGWRKAAAKHFGIDNALTQGSIRGGDALAKATWGVDRYLVDGIVNATGYISSGIGRMVGRLQTGYVRGYATVMTVGVAALIVYFVYAMVNLNGGAR
ncbi:MAG: NADH-quinone oxidoreductase subunit L [Armatimonadetes bacterium]|nr:NADH-quinone oxidoreductase subunit L [Armatimonadota bacterium]MBX3108654.1 NADH-quinone oxidoreductase subunit L [Fimbriimonadaceae bacterium]